MAFPPATPSPLPSIVRPVAHGGDHFEISRFPIAIKVTPLERERPGGLESSATTLS